jgi:hypothetical protein
MVNPSASHLLWINFIPLFSEGARGNVPQQSVYYHNRKYEKLSELGFIGLRDYQDYYSGIFFLHNYFFL